MRALRKQSVAIHDKFKQTPKFVIPPCLADLLSLCHTERSEVSINLNFCHTELSQESEVFTCKALREAVDKGINDIFRQNPAAYAKVKQLYDTALREYSTMKDIQTIIKKHNFYKQETDFADDLDKLVNFIIKGKGDEKTPNLERLLSSLTPQNRAVAEVNILKQLLDNTKIELKQQFGRGQTRTYFTWDFIDKLDALAKKDNIFKSQAAKDMIKVVKDWHLLNKNHADILMSLRPADVKEVRQGIATRIQGRLEQMRTNLLISSIFRLLDKLPFANSIWKKTQAGALRFHIKNALSNSVSIDDFKSKLTQKLNTGNFNNETKDILREIIGEADNAQKALNELDKAEMELAKKSDDELAQIEQRAKNTQRSHGVSLINGGEKAVNEIPNSAWIERQTPQNTQATAQSTPQAPQKSLLEQARENTERLRAEQEAAQIAQKEAAANKAFTSNKGKSRKAMI